MLTFKSLLQIIIYSLLLLSCQRNITRENQRFDSWQQIKQWSFMGKMAINNGSNSGSGKVNWHVLNQDITAKFKAPLGQGNWKIYASSNSAKLISSRNGNSFADNAETLISNELGWQFPWNNLHYWLRGYMPNDDLITHENLPQVRHYDGWEINYQKWMMTPIGWLPKKIKARKPPYSIKLIIYAWDIK